MSDMPPHLAGMTPAQIIAQASRLKVAREKVRRQAEAAERERLAERERALEVAQLQLFEQYRDDPVGFCEDVLGARLWSKQKEVMRAVASSRRTSVISGQKVSKSVTLALLALWWIKTRKRGRVIATAVKDASIREIFWREVRAFHAASRVPMGGEIFLTALHGLRFPDGRQIIGLTAKEAEGFGGWSGPEVLFLIDEASGVRDDVKQAIDGNMASDGCKCVAMANGLRTSGWFFESQTSGSGAWTTLQISSKETPNITGLEPPIPGLADKGWLAEMETEYGPEPEKDPVFQVRVLGLFPSADSTAVVPLELVLEATGRHAATEEDGPLVLGVDVGYEGDDETVIQPVRGKKALPAKELRKKDGNLVAAAVLEMLFGSPANPNGGLCKLDARGLPLAKPIVNIDKIGYGASAYDKLKVDPRLQVNGINVAEKATAKPPPGWPAFNKLRDQIWWGCREWLKAGGTLPPKDGKLRSDLLAVMLLPPTASGNMQVEGKPDMKKRLGRSPDHGDALCLAVYSPPPPPKVEVGRVQLVRR